jgi:hypothetical protein
MAFKNKPLDGAKRTTPPANSEANVFSGAASKLKSVTKLEEKITQLALTQARKVITKDISTQLDKYADEVIRGSQRQGSTITIEVASSNQSLIADKKLAAHYENRNLHALDALLDLACDDDPFEKKFQQAVLDPIKKELAQAGFGNPQFEWSGHRPYALVLTANAPKV